MAWLELGWLWLGLAWLGWAVTKTVGKVVLYPSLRDFYPWKLISGLIRQLIGAFCDFLVANVCRKLLKTKLISKSIYNLQKVDRGMQVFSTFKTYAFS